MFSQRPQDAAVDSHRESLHPGAKTECRNAIPNYNNDTPQSQLIGYTNEDFKYTLT